MISRKSGRHPKRTWKDGGRGSGRGLTRAFTGSKPLLIASLPAPGHTVLALILGDGWQMDALSRIDNRSPRLARIVWSFVLRSLGIDRRGTVCSRNVFLPSSFPMLSCKPHEVAIHPLFTSPSPLSLVNMYAAVYIHIIEALSTASVHHCFHSRLSEALPNFPQNLVRAT